MLRHALPHHRSTLTEDCRGTVMPYFAVTLAVLAGFVGLSIDGGRLMTTNTQAKSAADAAALAGATVLAAAVRAPGASPANPQPVINAVWQAIQQGVVNRHNFGTVTANGATATGGEVRITGLRLLTGLPEMNGGSAATAADAYVTTDPWAARLVEVTTETISETNFLLAAVGGATTATTQAVAIAGYHQVLCNTPPLWICNPADTGSVNDPVFETSVWRGREAILKAAGSGSQWGPGNFGLLDSPDGNGASAIAAMLATVSPNSCVSSQGADLRPGQASSTRTALNTRFDMYENPYFGGNGDRRNPNFRPALNVIKGYGGTCNSPTPNGYGMPRDSAFTNRMGNGNWNCQSYWTNNHAGTAPAGCTATTPSMSRYDMYRYEIDNSLIPNGTAPAHENGHPACYQGTTPPSDTPDRRVLQIALINCTQQALNGNRDDVPVAAFGKVFLPEPVAATPGDEVVVEFIDVVRPGADDGILHEIVQLYR